MNWKQFAEKEKGTLTYYKYVYEEEIGGSNPHKKIGVSFYKDYDTVVFDIKDNGEFNFNNFSHLGEEFSKDVVDFINQGADEWFKEKKYNIIIGKSSNFTITAYRKLNNDEYELDDYALLNGCESDDFEFTEEDIQDLKSKLPDNMAKIVDLGKTEVKTDE